MIKVYTTYSCPYCTRAKNYLDLHGIVAVSVASLGAVRRASELHLIVGVF